jgi:hypothetical protein
LAMSVAQAQGGEKPTHARIDLRVHLSWWPLLL